jgi:hypothetical protein
MNPAYLKLVHSFSPELIPYLRDDDGKRLQMIDCPYNILAPAHIYDQLSKLDERGNRVFSFVNSFRLDQLDSYDLRGDHPHS